jgi:hypothetical protein
MAEDDTFAQDSAAFRQWLSTLSGVKISPKIEITDLRSKGKGRAVSKLMTRDGRKLQI